MLFGFSNRNRIEKYTTLATPTIATSATAEQDPAQSTSHQSPALTQAGPRKTTNASSAALDTLPSYQQFPAQAARIPVNHSQTKLDTQQPTQENGSPLQPATSRDHTRTSSVVLSPKLAGLARETSWPVDGYGDLHLSGSEPRIFPGVVSRTQRRDSRAGQAVRQGSQSETDGDGSIGKGSVGKRGRGNAGLDGSVDEKVEESDGDMEEAGGTDE